jgi:hypothetical protein
MRTQGCLGQLSADFIFEIYTDILSSNAVIFLIYITVMLGDGDREQYGVPALFPFCVKLGNKRPDRCRSTSGRILAQHQQRRVPLECLFAEHNTFAHSAVARAIA